MHHRWSTTSPEYNRGRQRKEHRHENDERSRVNRDGLVEAAEEAAVDIGEGLEDLAD
jgi:hypothetical protein